MYSLLKTNYLYMKKIIICSALITFITSCGNKKQTEENKTTNDSATIETNMKNETEKEGIVGVMDVGELLTLAVKDSAKGEDVGFKIARAYGIIEADLNKLNVEVNGSEGILLYSNTPENFVFECVIPINKMPEVKPKKANIVILEATKAIVYNHYGAYNNMHKAYDKLKEYINENKLTQTGPTREFYITDSQTERDSSKWLSKIYIPVK